MLSCDRLKYKIALHYIAPGKPVHNARLRENCSTPPKNPGNASKYY